MRISDWSSDVCSSDLGGRAKRSCCFASRRLARPDKHGVIVALKINELCINCDVCEPACPNNATSQGEVIDRKSVVSGKSVYVRVDLGVRRIIKKKQSIK